MIELFSRHPSTVNETYIQHMRVALHFSAHFFYGAFVTLIHAFLPFLFEKNGSETVTRLHERMLISRTKQD